MVLRCDRATDAVLLRGSSCSEEDPVVWFQLLLLLPLAQISSRTNRPGYDTVLQPFRSSSRSGTYVLEVEPTDAEGTGPAHYVLKRGEQVVWEAEKDFSLWRAAVSERGVVAGYGYSDGPPKSYGGDLRVLLLSPQGEVMRDEIHVPEPSGGCTCPGPDTARMATKFFVHDELERAVFVIHDPKKDRQPEAWWVLDLETGKDISKLRPLEILPHDKPLGWSMRAYVVPGTPLVLAQWYRSEWIDALHDSRIGACFTLLDPAWKAVWQLDLPADYEVPGDERAESALRLEIEERGAILGVTAPGQFELRLVAARERVRFTIDHEEGATQEWIVREASRAPYEQPEPAPEAHDPVVSPIELASRGSVALGTVGDDSPSPIRDIEEYALLRKGEIEFIRREKEDGYSLVRVDADGRVLREVKLQDFDRGTDSTSWARLADGSWLLIASSYDPDRRARNWIVQASTGELVPISGFEGRNVEGVEGSPDGGFVVLGDHEAFPESCVQCFDANATLRWTIEAECGKKNAPCILQDVAPTSDGRVAVLDSHGLFFYDAEGRLLSEYEPATVLGQEPNYLADLTADVDGGVLLHDFEGNPPLWRVDGRGRVRTPIAISDPEGITAGDLERHAKVAPDGRVWSTDGRLFVGLDAGGTVCRCVGERPRPKQIYEPGAELIDPTGRIVVQDERTANVYVYDGGGGLLSVGEARSGDVEELDWNGRLAISGSGCVYAQRSDEWDQYLAFGPDGSHGDVRDFDGNLVTFVPRTEQCWCVRDHRIVRLGTENEILQTIDRRSDGRFFASIEDLAVAPDGRLAVLDGSELALFDAEGEAGPILPLPTEQMGSIFTYADKLAYAGRWAAIGDWDPEVLLVDTTDGSLHHFEVTPVPPEDTAWRFGFSGDGSELWLLECESLILHRYALP
jgi:hypothetical protein